MTMLLIIMMILMIGTLEYIFRYIYYKGYITYTSIPIVIAILSLDKIYSRSDNVSDDAK